MKLVHKLITYAYSCLSSYVVVYLTKFIVRFLAGTYFIHPYLEEPG